MKPIKIIVAFIISIWPLSAYSEQPPYRIKDQPYINKNFEQIFFDMANHNHGGEDSTQLSDVIPSSTAAFDLGSISRLWDNVYVSSSVNVARGTFTATSGSFYTKTSSTGVILKSQDATCFAVRVHNSGVLYTVTIPCPN